jgi:hypothetical protein
MTIEGEKKGTYGCQCTGCGTRMELQVLSSAGGFYLGYFCNRCGPYSRESHYMKTFEECKHALKGEADLQLREIDIMDTLEDGVLDPAFDSGILDSFTAKAKK